MDYSFLIGIAGVVVIGYLLFKSLSGSVKALDEINNLPEEEPEKQPPVLVKTEEKPKAPKAPKVAKPAPVKAAPKPAAIKAPKPVAKAPPAPVAKATKNTRSRKK